MSFDKEDSSNNFADRDINTINHHGRGNNLINSVQHIHNSYFDRNRHTLRMRIAQVLSILFGLVIANAVKQSASPTSFMPIFVGLFSYVFGIIVFKFVYLIWDIGVFLKRKFISMRGAGLHR